jgi:site-specific DNA-methyltransferase (adenine-specific)
MIKLSKILPNPNNPRLIKDDRFKKLVNSIKEFPKMMELRPMVVDENFITLGGNMRLKALKELGYKEIPDEWVKQASDLTPEESRRFIIADNVGFGEHDWEMLANEWDIEELSEWGLDIPDYAIKESELEEDDYEIPDKIETDIVLGDLFEIGVHRLLCGDSTQTDTFAKLFENKLADLVVTDPPYNVNYEGGTGLKIANDNMDDSSFYNFLYDFYTALNSYTKPGGAWYVWHADSEGVNFRKSMKESGILLKQCLIWVKSSLVLGRQDYQWRHEPCLEGVNAENWEWVKEHEPCLYGWKSGAGHFWKGGRRQTTILEFDKPNRNAEHPTMKPVLLIGYQIANSSKNGDIVADGFAGSGTTMIAAHQLNRKAYVVEFDPKYCQVIVDRMKKLDPSIEIKRNGIIVK